MIIIAGVLAIAFVLLILWVAASAGVVAAAIAAPKAMKSRSREVAIALCVLAVTAALLAPLTFNGGAAGPGWSVSDQKRAKTRKCRAGGYSAEQCVRMIKVYRKLGLEL